MAAAPPDPQGARVGQTAAGRYRVLSLLGTGGMGEVYEAEHLAVGKRVALKCLWRAFWDDPEQVARFEREARVASLVRSPHVVDVLDAGKLEDGAPFLVMELLEGTTLARELATNGAMSVERALFIVRQIAAGLEAAHLAGIVHRDLKPENVFLLRVAGRELVKILDFGVSKFRREDMDPDLTRTGTAIGTPTYMSPEQTEGMRHVDERADVWSLGVILFRMLTGELPFFAESYARLLIKVVSDEPAPRLRSRMPDLPRDLDAIVARCLEKSPAGRFASMAELVAALPGDPKRRTSTVPPAARAAPRSPPRAPVPQELADSATRAARPRREDITPAATPRPRPLEGGSGPRASPPVPPAVPPPEPRSGS